MKTSKNTKSLIGYIRISADKTNNEDASLSSQKALCEGFAKLQGYSDITIFSEVVSGYRADNRPEFQKAVKLAKSTKSTIWVYSLSRFSRSVVDCISNIKDFQKYGVGFHSHTENISTENAASLFTISILSSMAEFERNLAGERTKAALNHLKEKGKKYCRITPYGYDLSKDGNHLVKNKKEQRVISQMSHMRKEGFSYQAICDFLKKKSIKSKSGKDWGKKTISRILHRQPGAALA